MSTQGCGHDCVVVDIIVVFTAEPVDGRHYQLHCSAYQHGRFCEQTTAFADVLLTITLVNLTENVQGR